jgi:glycosyltransferase involved in cell wall biosynthesis
MRIATVFAGLPNPWRAGGPLTHWATLNALVEAGHEVVFFALPWDEERERDGKLEALAGLGVQVCQVERPVEDDPARGRWGERARYLRSLVWPDDRVLFPDSALARPLAAAIEAEDPDVVLAHATPAISAAAEIPRPKLALTSDPPGLSRRLRTQLAPTYPWRLGRDELLYRLGAAGFAHRADRRFLELLRRFDSVGIFAAHHAEWARERGVPAWYASSPIVDAAGPRWRDRRAEAPHNPVPRILMIGHLRGISTISGLHVLVEHVLPRLSAELGPGGFEVHVVGDHEPPEALRTALEHPSIRLRGHVEPPDEEFLRADVLLVPTPIRTGPRVRILTGFSFGCCVVAHSANRLGIPALAHGENVLLGESDRLADLTREALRDPELRRRLGAEGRRLYESRFTPETAGARIVERLEELAVPVAGARTVLPR